MKHVRVTSRKIGWSKVSLLLTLSIGLVFGLGASSAFAATTSVGTVSELKTALGTSSTTDILFTADIASPEQLNVPTPVTIDGAGHTLLITTDITKLGNGLKHALAFYGKGITVKNLTVDSALKAYGVNTYGDAAVTLVDVTLKNSAGAGLTVNGSTVTATRLYTSGNKWGAVNVDPGKGVTTPSVFTFVSGTLSESNKIWSDGVNVTTTATVTVTATGYVSTKVAGGVVVWSIPMPVYRFYRPSTGTHLYTADLAEMNRVLTTMASIYRLEGVAYSINTANAANSVPLYRFYRPSTGTHLYTADAMEMARIRDTMGSIYHLEGVAYNVSLTTGAPVARFFSPSKGVHFYSADIAEIASVQTNLTNIWGYEGVAFYIGQ